SLVRRAAEGADGDVGVVAHVGRAIPPEGPRSRAPRPHIHLSGVAPEVAQDQPLILRHIPRQRGQKFFVLQCSASLGVVGRLILAAKRSCGKAELSFFTEQADNSLRTNPRKESSVMELRCRPGDLAVVVRCGDVLLPANLGALVQVVDRHTYDPAFGHVEEPAWQCIALSRIRVPLAQTEDEILELWAGNRLYVQDQFLRPLRNSTARDPFARPGAPRRYKAPALQA